MAAGAWEARAASDQWVERLAPQWPPRRQPGVDRNILRLAVWELTNTDTPPKVVIDEAIELAKQFSTEQSPAFVNGVLDAVLKEQQTLTGRKSEPVEPSLPVQTRTQTPLSPMAFFSKDPRQAQRRLRKTAAGAQHRRPHALHPRPADRRCVPRPRSRRSCSRRTWASRNVDRIVAEIRDRWRLGKIRNADEAGGVIRDEVLAMLTAGDDARRAS